MSERELTPTAGVRLLLERDRVDGTRAHYRASVITPDARHDGTAILDETGAHTLDVPAAPLALAEPLAMLCKLIARAAAKRIADGLPAWPPRILRWRGPGRGA